MRHTLPLEELTYSIIGAFFEVYNVLGFGFLERFYSLALERELIARGHRVEREVRIAVSYKGQWLGWQRIDMLVDDAVVVEVKAAMDLHKYAKRQVYSYLRASAKQVGLLLHFGLEPAFHRLDNPGDPVVPKAPASIETQDRSIRR